MTGGGAMFPAPPELPAVPAIGGQAFSSLPSTQSMTPLQIADGDKVTPPHAAGRPTSTLSLHHSSLP